MIPITIVFMGFINQLITEGAHNVCHPVCWMLPVIVITNDSPTTIGPCFSCWFPAYLRASHLTELTKTGLGDYDFLSFCSKKEMCSKYLKVLGFQSIFQLTIPQYSTATNSGCLFLPSVEHGAATRCWTVAPHRRDSQRYLPAIVRWLAQYVAKWVWRCIVKYVIFHDYICIYYIY